MPVTMTLIGTVRECVCVCVVVIRQDVSCPRQSLSAIPLMTGGMAQPVDLGSTIVQASMTHSMIADVSSSQAKSRGWKNYREEKTFKETQV